MGVKSIHDAISVVEGLCTDWIILLDQLKLRNGLDHPVKKFQGASLDLITEKLTNHKIKEAKELLEKNIMGDPVDPKSLLYLGATYFNEKTLKKPSLYLPDRSRWNFISKLLTLIFTA